MPVQRWILHADMDAFFASVEIRDCPELRGRPVIVSGLSERGVVAAASYEARKFGVRSAMPTFQARQLCPGGVFLSPNMEKYGKVSAIIHEIFYEITPQIEPIALDEAFLDITGSLSLFGEPIELGRRIKERVRQVANLTVSVGIAENKLLAKVACTLGKPDGLKFVPKGQGRVLLEPLPVRRLWTIGPVAAAALEKAGIRRIGELARATPPMLEPYLGRRSAEVIQLARGIDDRPVVAEREAKSFGEECTFERDTLDRTTIADVLTGHSEAVARRMRRDNMEGKTVTLKARLGRRVGGQPDRNRFAEEAPRYPLVTRAKTLSHYTAEGATIRDTALSLWDELALTAKVRLIGVSVSNLREADQGQLSLFTARREDPRVGKTLDAIEARFGRGVISRGAVSAEKLTPSVQRKRGD
jgi:DNA polymerase-4